MTLEICLHCSSVEPHARSAQTSGDPLLGAVAARALQHRILFVAVLPLLLRSTMVADCLGADFPGGRPHGGRLSVVR